MRPFVCLLQILQITLLVADYMNMIGKTAPGLMPAIGAPGTPKSNLSRANSRANSRARGLLNTAPNTPRPDRNQQQQQMDTQTPKLSKKWSNQNLDS